MDYTRKRIWTLTPIVNDSRTIIGPNRQLHNRITHVSDIITAPIINRAKILNENDLRKVNLVINAVHKKVIKIHLVFQFIPC